MNLKKVYLYTSLISIASAIGGYFMFSFQVSLGLILGSISGLISMSLLVTKFENIDLSDYKYLSKSMKGNRLLRYLIYAVTLLLGVIVPSLFHVLGIFVGILIVKVSVYIDALTLNKK